MGETYDEEGGAATDVKERGDQYAAAKKVFEKLMYIDDKEPLCWQGRAWAAQCDFKAGEEGNAIRAFTELLTKKNNPAAAAGVRVARYFGIFRAFEKETKDERQRWVRAETAASEWLRDYPAYRNTQEGIGARYYLAYMKYVLGRSDLVYDKNNKRPTGFKNTEAKPRLEEAQRLFRELTDSDNEHSEKASRYRSIILVSLADAENRGDSPPADTLATFELCFLMAQVEIARLGQFQTELAGKKDPKKEEEPKSENPKKEDPKKTPPKKGATAKSEPVIKEADKAEEQKKEPEKKAGSTDADAFAREEIKRYTNAMGYLERALRLATPKDSVREVVNAHLYLVDCYRKLKLVPQAAILGDHVAHLYPKQPRAALAAYFAMRSYNIAHLKPAK
jgi:tetratricopeptide (TPR) repeat protein